MLKPTFSESHSQKWIWISVSTWASRTDRYSDFWEEQREVNWWTDSALTLCDKATSGVYLLCVQLLPLRAVSSVGYWELFSREAERSEAGWRVMSSLSQSLLAFTCSLSSSPPSSLHPCPATDVLSNVTDCCNLDSGQPLSKLPESLWGLVSLTHD